MSRKCLSTLGGGGLVKSSRSFLGPDFSKVVGRFREYNLVCDHFFENRTKKYKVVCDHFFRERAKKYIIGL